MSVAARRGLNSLRVFHLLPEGEAFSEYTGGAISRWCGNVLRGDETAVVIAPRWDESWGMEHGQVRRSRGLRMYASIPERLRGALPQKATERVRGVLLQRLLAGELEVLGGGDVLYIHNRPEFALALAEGMRRKGVLVVLHMHNAHLDGYEAGAVAEMHLAGMAFCSRFLMERAATGLGAVARARVIPNGADEELFHPARRGEPGSASGETWGGAFHRSTVLFVGRLVWEKGAHLLVEAMRLLTDWRVPVRARIVGDAGEDTSRAAGIRGQPAYVRELLLAAGENVEFVEYETGKTLAAEYRNADIFCCPSCWEEPFGMVNVEAMATGLPVVATRVGGIPEIFSDGGAVLVEMRATELETARALAVVLRELVEQPGRRVELSAQGLRVYQERYRWPVIRSEYRAWMDQIRSDADRAH